MRLIYAKKKSRFLPASLGLPAAAGMYSILVLWKHWQMTRAYVLISFPWQKKSYLGLSFANLKLAAYHGWLCLRIPCANPRKLGWKMYKWKCTYMSFLTKCWKLRQKWFVSLQHPKIFPRRWNLLYAPFCTVPSVIGSNFNGEISG